MFTGTLLLIKFGITAAVTLVGYWQARQFVQKRLRYVDAVHRAGVPILAGLGAALIATPVAALLPLVTVTTAILFGAGVAVGVNAGAREIRKRIGA
ncbi:MAG TPA: hypothetical protein VN706_00120 [Gemmatimonadaceae bacterium]|nr:hypothetical protein [Gemmatimonadaceae bacterium]